MSTPCWDHYRELALKQVRYAQIVAVLENYNPLLIDFDVKISLTVTVDESKIDHQLLQLCSEYSSLWKRVQGFDLAYGIILL